MAMELRLTLLDMEKLTLKKPKILLLEDEVIIGMDVKSFLWQRGFEVVLATDCDVALRWLSEQTPDVPSGNTDVETCQTFRFGNCYQCAAAAWHRTVQLSGG